MSLSPWPEWLATAPARKTQVRDVLPTSTRAPNHRCIEFLPSCTQRPVVAWVGHRDPIKHPGNSSVYIWNDPISPQLSSATAILIEPFLYHHHPQTGPYWAQLTLSHRYGSKAWNIGIPLWMFIPPSTAGPTCAQHEICGYSIWNPLDSKITESRAYKFSAF